MKRKRSNGHMAERTPKRLRDISSQSTSATPPTVDHPVLRRLYPQVFTLRQYVLSRLPTTSKNRRRRISQLRQLDPSHGVDYELAELLDSTLIGCQASSTTQNETIRPRQEDLQRFSQLLQDSNSGNTFKSGYFLQSEIVDFVIWLVFQKSPSSKPSHLLCHSFQRPSTATHNGVDRGGRQRPPGNVNCTSNAYVKLLKGPLWGRLHSLLGRDGNDIMMDLLLNCAIFSRVEGSLTNYYQISGYPSSDIRNPTDAPVASTSMPSRKAALSGENRKPSAIVFVRSRMLYADAALNAKGGVRFGMRHIHVLNRFPDVNNAQQTTHIMRYIFPRQFGLHNVFTSKIDRRETAMPFTDYTLREKEINQSLAREAQGKEIDDEMILKRKSRLPARLRGEPFGLVARMRKLNKKCSYVELLRHYCPVEGLDLSPTSGCRNSLLQPTTDVPAAANPSSRVRGISHNSRTRAAGQTCFTDMACPAAHVSAFCRAVMSRVIPNGFWGDENNRRIIMHWVDQFIYLRKFESLSLHQVMQKIQITSLAWLRPPGQDPTTKMAKTDSDKRLEIFQEFVYWVFDSFLVPLIRSNFRVTETNVHRNRLFYFRHDVWRMLTEPCLASLRVNMFEEMADESAIRVLSHRPIGYSKIRLLPKQSGLRLIMNLKRRQQLRRNGVTMLGRSINSVMTPVFNAITYEKSLHPDKFGCSLFSVGDMFPRLTCFKRSLSEQGLADSRLYFAKVDVQSCFDTIPQQRLLAMVESLLTLEAYQSGKHAELRPLERLQRLDGEYVDPLPIRRYVAHTGAVGEFAAFGDIVRDQVATTKGNTIFVDTAAHQVETKHDLMRLLREHVERNLVKIGKRFYRQRTGIPQGSVLSSILCNYFYAEFEREKLGFALGAESLLLRLLDDFCLITTKREIAERFVEVIHRTHDDYGLCVKREKSLVNFDAVCEDGYSIPRCASDGRFPYCGVLLDTKTLEVSKNSRRVGQASVVDSLTVDMAKVPGQTFHRKTLNGFKIQLQAMLIDTSLNSVETVLANLHQGLHEAAVRCFEYVRSLSRARPTHSRLLIKTVESLMALAYVMLQRRTRSRTRQNVERVRSVISRKHIQWSTCKAFEAVFQRRQTQHRAFLAWIGNTMATARPRCGAERRMLENAAVAWRAGRSGSGGAGR